MAVSPGDPLAIPVQVEIYSGGYHYGLMDCNMYTCATVVVNLVGLRSTEGLIFDFDRFWMKHEVASFHPAICWLTDGRLR